MTFDLTKPVQTRDGHPARIICTDARDKFWRDKVPMLALLETEPGLETIAAYKLDGTGGVFLESTTQKLPPDLINVPVKHVRWVNMYAGCGHETLDEADEAAARTGTHHRLACIRVEYQEGEGLGQV